MKFEVRDTRAKDKFFVDDEYLNGYAKHLGATTSMVYFVLCRHSSRLQECYPSYEYVAEKLGVSEATVKRSISTLKKWNIVGSGKQARSNTGTYRHNTYYLIDKKHWLDKPKVTDDPRHRRSPVTLTEGHLSASPRVTHDPLRRESKKEREYKENAEQSSAPQQDQSINDWEQYLTDMESKGQRHLDVIAYYFREKGISFDTKAKVQAAIKRHLRAAKQVAAFSDNEIDQARQQAAKEYPDNYTIETILKVLTR